MTEKDVPVLAVERQEFILNLLQQNGIVRNTELRDLLRVSIVTVRADIKELEARGLCKVIWGGAVTEQYRVANVEYYLDEREYVNREAKRRIGARAAKLVQSGHTIVVDAGTTTVEMVNNLPSDLTYLRLVTNALNIASAAHGFDYIDLLVTGGSLKRPTYSLTGLQAIKVFESINSDYVFLATEGITVEHGLTSSYTLDVEVKQSMIQTASTIVVLADSSKFGRVMPLKIAPLEKIDLIITDQGLSESTRLSLEKEGVEVILA